MHRISEVFSVIPAPHQVRDKLQPESSVFKKFWTPAFAGVTVFGNIDDLCNYALGGLGSVGDEMGYLL